MDVHPRNMIIIVFDPLGICIYIIYIYTQISIVPYNTEKNVAFHRDSHSVHGCFENLHCVFQGLPVPPMIIQLPIQACHYENHVEPRVKKWTHTQIPPSNYPCLPNDFSTFPHQKKQTSLVSYQW